MSNNIVKEGKWGECSWSIDSKGEFTIGEGLAESVAYVDIPWKESAAAITSARTEGKVSFPEGSSLMELFKGCKNLESADLSGFDTENVIDMNSMFEGCVNLKKLDISSFDTRRCTDMRRMFSHCSHLDEILLGQNFSATGDGTTSCDKLAIKGHGAYRKAKTIQVDGFRVFYHSNDKEDEVEVRKTIPDYRYMIEAPMFPPPGEGAAFAGWNTNPYSKGNMYKPGSEIDAIDEDIDLYAIWMLPPVISELSQPRSFIYGEPIPFEMPEITSFNDPHVSGFLEISRTGEEDSWHPVDRYAILPAAFDGCLIRLHASNSVGEAVSAPVKLSIRKASFDLSAIRWVETDNMVYDGKPKEVHIEGLPEGINISYEGNEAVEAGTYVARFALEYDRSNFNEPHIIKEHEWTIRKATLDMSEVRWDYTGAFEFDGTEKGVRLVGLPEGVSATYQDNTAIDAGVYTATASLQYDYKNFERPSEIMPCIWEIKKEVISSYSLRWSSYDGLVYDGNTKSVMLTNLPEDAIVEYEGAEETLAGKYLARATLLGNYAASSPIEYEWEIEKARYDFSQTEWSEQNVFTYDGESHGVVLRGVPEDLHVRYTGNTGTISGKYRARATFDNPDTHNYVTPNDMCLDWEITKQVADMSDVHWDYDEPFTYDGEVKTVSLVGLPDGVRAEYEGNVAYDAGIYTAHAVLRYDETNVEVSQPADCQWKINKAKFDVSQAHWDYDNTFVYDGTEKGVYLVGLPEGLNVEYSGNVKIDSGKYVASATLIPSDIHNYEIPEINGCTWAIGKADIMANDVTWTDSSGFVYDGNEKKVEIISPVGDALEIEYEANTAINAGRHFTRAIFRPVDDTNFSAPSPVGHSWDIAKARYDMSGVVWDYEGDITYDGSLKSVKLVNVPDGIIVSYKNEIATEAGDYTAVASFEVQDENNYETNIPDMMLDWKIKKAFFDMSTVKWQDEREFEYTGDEHKITLTGIPEGLTPVYKNNIAIDAGIYTARVDFEFDTRNYEKPEVPGCNWQINRATIDVSGVSWDYDGGFVYDGGEKSVSVAGLPAGTYAMYSSASAVNAGMYVASAEIMPEDSENYISARIDNLTWRIEKNDFDMSHAHWDDDQAFVYDGSEHTVLIKGLPEGVKPAYRGNSAVDAGDYRANVSFTVVDERNYNVPTFEPFDWTIRKADYDMSGASWNYDGEFSYSGRMYEVTLRGLPEGVRAIYSGNAAADTGTYEASADLIPQDPENYNKPVINNCKWRIAKADVKMGAVKWNYSGAKVYNGRLQSVELEHLPAGVSAIYHDNEKKDSGKYTASAELILADPDNYNTPSVSDCDWEIVSTEYDMNGVEWDYTEGKFVYDGSKKAIRLKGLPEGLEVTYKGTEATHAGYYEAMATFESENSNYKEPAAKTISWCIDKADYDMSKVRWDYTNSFTYDGSPKRIELVGLPEGITVEYSGNVAIDAGTYEAIARFGSDNTDFNNPEGMACTWTIDKADVDIRRLRWDYSQSFVYSGSVKKFELKGVPDTLEVSYSGNTGVTAGEYIARADLVPKNPNNYNKPVVRDCSWEIIKADYDMSNARWDGGLEYVYDRTEKVVTVTGLPEGVTPVYSNNSAVNAGTYLAEVSFLCDTDNYNTPVMRGCKWVIEKANYDMSDVMWQTEDAVYDGRTKHVMLTGLPEGVTAIYDGNEAVDAGEYIATAEFRYDTENYNKPSFGAFKWNIEPADVDIDISQVRWNYIGPFIYDGEAKRVGIAERTHGSGLFGKLMGKDDVTLSGIPDGFDVIYSNNTATKAGIYYASAKLVNRNESRNYKELILPQCKWEIAKAPIDMRGVHWDYEGAFTYDGEEKRVELVGLPDTVTVTYKDNAGTNAGEHEAMAYIDLIDSENYELPGQVSGCWWRIDKATYDMSEARWTYNDDIVYNGNEKSIRVVGLPEGVKVDAYRGNKGIDAGSYVAEVILNYQDHDNYEEPTVPAQKWRIRKKKIDTSDVAWNYDESTLYVYDAKPKEVALVGLPKDVDVIYIDNSKINAGTYTARARLVYDSRNCEVDDIPDLRWKIEKASYDTSGVYWTYEAPFSYDGSEKSIMLKGMPASIAIRYRDNRASAVGSYTAKAYLTYESDNYNAPEFPSTIDWEILKPEEAE